MGNITTEKIQAVALWMSKKHDEVDINHICNYYRRVFGERPDYDIISQALEDIDCFQCSYSKYDITNARNFDNEIPITEPY